MEISEQLRRIEGLLLKSSSAEKPVTAQSVTASSERVAEARVAPIPIAIVGIAGSFPKCSTVQDFWRALKDDVSLIDAIGPDRFDWAGSPTDTYEDDEEIRRRCRWAGLMDRPFGFDAEFFTIVAGEAELMDPRQRLLMMSVYHCLEDAGYAPDALKKSQTGLFIGVEDSEYGQSLSQLGVDPGLANLPSMIANRIAYHYDFAGPSEFVNTLCSSGAVALHRACNALRCGEITQALVGAANVLVRPEPFWRLAEMEQLSADRTVHSFGRNADGYLRADGVGSVMLKTLPQAEKDGDSIYALIKCSSVNFGGQGGMSMVAPNIASHVSLIKQCYRDAGIDPRELDYIEAQGMGTPVSDMVEWHAFNRALLELARERGLEIPDSSCNISTVKPVMGHMHAASAFGALFKVILSLQSETIYKIRDLTDISGDLPGEHQPCKLLRENTSWVRRARPRLAGVHSYGLGGNNAHLLIEEYVGARDATANLNNSGSSNLAYVMPFSARSPQQCWTLVDRCRALLEVTPEVCLASLAHTLQVGRDAFEHRVVFLTSSADNLIAQLQAYLKGRPPVFEGDAGVSNASRDTAQRWLQGERVEWSLLHSEGPTGNVTRSRLRLPGYPFVLIDYRLDAGGSIQGSAVKKLRFADIEGNLSFLEKTRHFITAYIAQALHADVELIDPLQDLQLLGIDSLIAIDLMRTIHGEFGVKLSGRDLRESDSINSLAAQIEKRLAVTEVNGDVRADHLSVDKELLDDLEKFKRGDLDLEQIKQLLS